MAYSESKKLTGAEKRMQTLKNQLFGKESSQFKPSVNIKIDRNDKPFVTSNTYQTQDLTYLRNDLKKIFILATLAISIQLILYMQFTLKILRFN